MSNSSNGGSYSTIHIQHWQSHSFRYIESCRVFNHPHRRSLYSSTSCQMHQMNHAVYSTICIGSHIHQPLVKFIESCRVFHHPHRRSLYSSTSCQMHRMNHAAYSTICIGGHIH